MEEHLNGHVGAVCAAPSATGFAGVHSQVRGSMRSYE